MIALKKFGYKPNLFMKPCEDGSSIDIFKISNDEDYKKAKLNCLNLERNLSLRSRSKEESLLLRLSEINVIRYRNKNTK